MLASLDAAHEARLNAQSNLVQFQRNLPSNMDMRRPVDSHATPGLLAFGLGGVAPGGQVTAKLDGQANVNVTLLIDAPPELLAMIRAGVSTTASGDLRPNTGVSMPESSPSQGGRNPYGSIR